MSAIEVVSVVKKERRRGKTLKLGIIDKQMRQDAILGCLMFKTG